MAPPIFCASVVTALSGFFFRSQKIISGLQSHLVAAGEKAFHHLRVSFSVHGAAHLLCFRGDRFIGILFPISKDNLRVAESLGRGRGKSLSSPSRKLQRSWRRPSSVLPW